MATHNGISFVDMRNLNLKGGSIGSGVLRFQAANNSFDNAGNWASNPIASDQYGLYINSTGSLVYSSLGSTTILGAAGGPGSVPTWSQIFAGQNTFTLTGTTWTIDNNTGNNDVLTITNTGAGSGDLIQLTNSGTGNDIRGTSNTWMVDKTGAATFVSVAVTTNVTGSTGLTLSASGSGVITIGANTNTITLAKAVTFSSTITATSGTANFGSSANSEDIIDTNNTITTRGASSTASQGQVVFRSTSLTTGTLLRLQLAQGALTTGKYIEALDSTAVATVFSVAANGATTIAGSAFGTAALTVTAGDLIISSGKVSATAASNSATAFSFTNNTATSASVFALAGSGVFTGSTTTSFLTITPSGLTTGTAVYLVTVALTTGKALHIVPNALTTGQAVLIAHTTSVIADGGSLLRITSTSVDTGGATNGTLLDLSSSGATAATLIKVTDTAITTGTVAGFSASAQTTGHILVLTSTGTIVTTGDVLSIIANSATTSTGLVRVSGTGLTSGTALIVTGGGANMTSAGNVVSFTGGANTDGNVLEVISTGVYTGTIGVSSVLANSMTTGTLAVFSATGATTGTLIEAIATAATLTTGFYFAANDGALNVLTIGANGHITSKQTTAPTIAVGTQNGITAAAITAGSSDVAGNITTTGTSTGGTIFTVTFNKTYTAAPKVVILTPANANAAPLNTMAYVSSITATTFVVTIPAGGTYAATPSYNYLVIA